MIKDGRVAEQGSHEELIRAKGNYADLWSKQVFLKPKAAEAANESVVTEGSETLSVVNDLTAEMTESELAKVQKPTTPTNLGGNLTPARTEDDKRSAAVGHVKEVQTPKTGHLVSLFDTNTVASQGSKLNPDAPEFTPRSVPPQVSLTPTMSLTRQSTWASEDCD